eukprot:2858670-Prymnesium_polylepis.1
MACCRWGHRAATWLRRVTETFLTYQKPNYQLRHNCRVDVDSCAQRRGHAGAGTAARRALCWRSALQ